MAGLSCFCCVYRALQLLRICYEFHNHVYRMYFVSPSHQEAVVVTRDGFSLYSGFCQTLLTRAQPRHEIGAGDGDNVVAGHLRL